MNEEIKLECNERSIKNGEIVCVENKVKGINKIENLVDNILQIMENVKLISGETDQGFPEFVNINCDENYINEMDKILDLKIDNVLEANVEDFKLEIDNKVFEEESELKNSYIECDKMYKESNLEQEKLPVSLKFLAKFVGKKMENEDLLKEKESYENLEKLRNTVINLGVKYEEIFGEKLGCLVDYEVDIV
ncbi:unnamed protein product [Gordionus sp. m RMFG-2023]